MGAGALFDLLVAHLQNIQPMTLELQVVCFKFHQTKLMKYDEEPNYMSENQKAESTHYL